MNLTLHEKQSTLFHSKATEILYGGSAGGGKSHAMRVIAIYYAITVPNIQIYLFRRLSGDLKKNHLDGASGFVSLLQDLTKQNYCKINYTNNQIVFKNGAKIHLCHCQYEKDVTNYQGVEIHLLLIDELTHFTEYVYKYLRSRVRLGGLQIPNNTIGTLPKIICGSNPGGVGHDFVKQFFIDILEPLTIKQIENEEGGMLRQYIPARLTDNPTMLENDPMYEYKLLGLGGTLAKAMLEGDWDAIEGAYFHNFDKQTHIIPYFDIPHHWTRIRAFDWGYSAPFCVLWGAVSDGTLVNINGVTTSLPKDAIIIYREYYGYTGKPNKGLKLTTPQIAQKTKEYQQGEKMNIQVADPAIFDCSRGTSIAEELTSLGVLYEPADNKRIAGWQQINSRLIGKDNKPLLYIFEHCKNLIRTLPIMQHNISNPEDIDTTMEDHAGDTLRYLCMTKPITIELEKPLDMNEVSRKFIDDFNPHYYGNRK